MIKIRRWGLGIVAIMCPLSGQTGSFWVEDFEGDTPPFLPSNLGFNGVMGHVRLFLGLVDEAAIQNDLATEFLTGVVATGPTMIGTGFVDADTFFIEFAPGGTGFRVITPTTGGLNFVDGEDEEAVPAVPITI